MTTDQTTPPEEDTREFGRGYFAFFGAVAGLFVVAAVVITLVIALDAFQSGSDDGTAGPSPVTTAPSGGSSGSGDAAAGQEIFAGTCAACHGADAMGIPGLGKPLVASAFVTGLSDEELLAFIEEGRPADHPDNTTGVAMPPKGGNPSLSDDDLKNVIAYLRTIN